jgi:hypothetical protein
MRRKDSHPVFKPYIRSQLNLMPPWLDELIGVIDDVFALVMEYLAELGYLKLENHFVDGTKIKVDANRHEVVWEKRMAKYAGRLREKVRELLRRIDEVNPAEYAKYGGAEFAKAKGNCRICPIFELIGSPARVPKKRGKAPGWPQGKQKASKQRMSLSRRRR